MELSVLWGVIGLVGIFGMAAVWVFDYLAEEKRRKSGDGRWWESRAERRRREKSADEKAC